MTLNIFENWTRDMFFLAQLQAYDFIGKAINGFKQPGVRISIWTVNGSQNEVSVVRKFNVDYQGFIIGFYDIEIYVMVFINNN